MSLFGKRGNDANRRTGRNDLDPDPQTTTNPEPPVTSVTVTNAGETTGTGTIDTLIPILGFKLAKLEWHPRGLWRIVNNRGTLLRTEGIAECQRERYGTPQHRSSPPIEGCSCGFYATKSPDHLNFMTYGEIQLDVELAGKVIVHADGYRAQCQRVLKIHRPTCWLCGTDAAGVALVEIPTKTTSAKEIRPYCSDHEHLWPMTVKLERIVEINNHLPLEHWMDQ